MQTKVDCQGKAVVADTTFGLGAGFDFSKRTEGDTGI